jgi:hypothetical protein
MQNLVAYLVAAMLSWSPIAGHAYIEAPVITEARYLDFATHVANVTMVEAPLFSGVSGSAKTALLLVAISSYETGQFDADVIFCKKSGDGGKAWGPYQSHADKDRACVSVESATHLALEQMRYSLATCSYLQPEKRLAAYASGSCDQGRAESIRRMGRMMNYWTAHTYPSDSAMSSIVSP